MRTLVLNNISSGYGDGAIYDFVRALTRSGDEVCIRSFDADSARDLPLEGLDRFDAVVASGGDGTVASVCYALRGTGKPILPFPAGTANLLAQNIESPFEPHSLAEILRSGRTLDFDMGEIAVGGESHGFLMIAGCGYDADIMSKARPNKRLFGPIAYFMAAFDTPNPQMADFTLEIDGERIEKSGVGVMLVNFGRLQFDIPVVEQNRPCDGMFDIVVLATKNAWDLIPTAAGAAIDRSGGTLKQSNALAYFRGSRVRIEASPSLPVQYDGEALDATTPIEARIVPHAARLLISEDGYRRFA